MLQTVAYSLSQIMLQAQLPGIFPSLCTVQSPDTAQGPTGNPAGTFSNVSGLVDIPCMDAPPSMARIQATEVKVVEDIMSKGLRHVMLNQSFDDAPNWSGRGYRVVVDGIVYDLLGAENDSQEVMTRLDLQLASVAGGF